MRLDPPGSSTEPTAPVAGRPRCPGVEEGCKSWVETGKGAGLAEGIFCKNEIILFRDRSSSRWFAAADGRYTGY